MGGNGCSCSAKCPVHGESRPLNAAEVGAAFEAATEAVIARQARAMRAGIEPTRLPAKFIEEAALLVGRLRTTGSAITGSTRELCCEEFERLVGRYL